MKRTERQIISSIISDTIEKLKFVQTLPDYTKRSDNNQEIQHSMDIVTETINNMYSEIDALWYYKSL